LRGRNYRPLIGPAALAAFGFLAHALAGLVAAQSGLVEGGMTAQALRAGTGILAWVAFAWALLRLLRVLLRGHPRLLTDLLGAALFAAATVAILLLVFELPAGGLIATSSVLIAVIGFALRNIIGDIFSGIALGIEAPYRVGDWIEAAEGCAGRVVEVTWRATRLVTRDSVLQVVPNGLIAGHKLANYGPNATGRYRTALRVPLDASLPAERARRILLAAALDVGRGVPQLAPDVMLAEYSNGTAIYVLRFFVPDYGREIPVRDMVAAAVQRALHRAGLAVARPTQDFRLQRPPPPAARPRREALLRHVELFRPFDEAERAELAGLMTERVFPAGAVIVNQGEEGDSLYLLAEGVLDVTIARPEGELTDRLVPGAVFGEMSLLTGQPRSATIEALTDAVAYELRKDQLDPVLRRRPELLEGLAAIMAERQNRNAERGRVAAESQAQASPALRDDLLGRLRAFFQLR